MLFSYLLKGMGLLSRPRSINHKYGCESVLFDATAACIAGGTRAVVSDGITIIGGTANMLDRSIILMVARTSGGLGDTNQVLKSRQNWRLFKRRANCALCKPTYSINGRVALRSLKGGN